MMWRCLFLLLALGSSLARADTPLTLFKTFTGNVNFTGTVVTMRTGATACSIYSASTTLSVALAGIPTNATILSAQLYWAGSGSTPDYTVGFESGNVTSTAARSYTSQSVGYDYFSGAVDVTAQVAARRNGNYQFYGLTVNNGAPYCAVEAVLSGFTLLVVYSDASQPFRVLNLYEGFQYYRSSSVTTTMSNVKLPSPLTSTTTGRVGHITWEGDPTAGQTGEDISFNGVKMTDSLNPSGNQFNSKSNINGNTASYGVDLDAYDVASPVIQAGQTSATTLYQSGTDMVLLSAQLIAVPSVPLVDLSLNMTRNGPFQTGTPGSYTLSVFNAGPSTEVGPITLVDTLPAGLTYQSGTGTRWDCAASGQVVTCKYNGLFTINTYLPDITLTVLPTAEGTITNTASVSGVNAEVASANNSDSDTTTVTRGAVTYVFTDGVCQPNVAFGTSGQCSLLTQDTRLPAALSVNGFLTMLSGGRPVARSTTAATTVNLNIAMTCILPVKNAGVAATANNVTLPLCADGPAAPAANSTAWSAAIPMTFEKNAATTTVPFYYADVGRVILSVKDPAGVIASSPTVVWRPVALRINGGVASATSSSGPYRAAGATFPITVDALMVNGAAAKNFGNGDAAVTVTFARPSASADDKTMAAAMGAFPDVTTTGLKVASGGVFTGTGTFYEVGVLEIGASIDNGYLGTNDVTDAVLKVGRFYPFSFQTKVTPVFPECAKVNKLVTCPTGVPGAAYATQGFTVKVVPLDVNDKPLQNFRGVFADTLILTAVDGAGSASALAPAGGVLTATKVARLPATGTIDALLATASYALPAPFNRALAPATAWTASAPIYLRATAESAVDTAGARLTSKQADISLEDGILILNGRLRLSTVPGSELLRLPVTMDAQFWYKSATGPGSWIGNQADTGATPTTIAFSNCRRNLLVSASCYSELKMTPRDTVFTAGTARFFIAAPGAGRTGSAMFNMTGAPAWLPSTLAQAVFGVYKSNFIYIRELY
jgi:MSHA biogenesis protein MshQ